MRVAVEPGHRWGGGRLELPLRHRLEYELAHRRSNKTKRGVRTSPVTDAAAPLGVQRAVQGGVEHLPTCVSLHVVSDKATLLLHFVLRVFPLIVFACEAIISQQCADAFELVPWGELADVALPQGHFWCAAKSITRWALEASADCRDDSLQTLSRAMARLLAARTGAPCCRDRVAQAASRDATSSVAEKRCSWQR